MGLKKGKVFGSPIARRIFLQFVLAAIVPVSVLGYLSYSQVENLLKSKSQSELRETAKNYGLSLFQRLELAVRELDRQTENGYSEDDQASPGAVFLSISGWMPTVETTGVAIENNKVVLKQVSNDHGPFGQAVLAPNYLFGDPSHLPYETSICVFSDKGSAIYCSDGRTRNPPTTGTSSKWSEGGTEYMGTSYQLFLASKFQSQSWTILAFKPKSIALSDLQAFRSLVPPLLTLAIALVALLSRIQIRRVLRPLGRLVNATQRIADRDFSRTLKLDTQDEFQHLADSMNSMSRQLSFQFNTLTQLGQLDQMILREQDIAKIAETVTSTIQDLFSPDFAAVLILDPNSNRHAQRFVSEGHKKIEVERLTLTNEQLDSLAKQPLNEFTDAKELSLGGKMMLPIRNDSSDLGAVFVSNPLFQEHESQLLNFRDRLAVAIASVEKEKELYRRANIDSLTGLPNRQLFYDRLNRLIARCRGSTAQGFAILFIDLDRFKNVNDAQGHNIGDLLLKQAAERLSSSVDESETVARLGGDEFIMTLQSDNNRDIAAVANEIVRTIHEPFLVDGKTLYVGASIGIARFPQDGVTTNHLIKNADTAMYRAKQGGRNQSAFFEEKMNLEILEQNRIEGQLRHAVQNMDFDIFFQPKFCTETMNFVGAEALIRWPTAGADTMSPQVFVPLLEDLGLIKEVGKWVLMQSCLRFVQWPTQTGLHVAVNVSAAQLTDPDFLEDVEFVLAATGIPPNSLELEITESILIEDKNSLMMTLQKLRSLGVRIVIDDFGTGYSSLSYLQWLPVDGFKMDKQFLDTASTDETSRTIVEAIVLVAKNLGKTLVAEGVETEDQLKLLQELGCEMAQGFLFSKPLTHEALMGFAFKLTHQRVDDGATVRVRRHGSS